MLSNSRFPLRARKHNYRLLLITSIFCNLYTTTVHLHKTFTLWLAITVHNFNHNQPKHLHTPSITTQSAHKVYSCSTCLQLHTSFLKHNSHPSTQRITHSQEHTPTHTTQLPHRRLSDCITTNYNSHGYSAAINTLSTTHKYGRSLTLNFTFKLIFLPVSTICNNGQLQLVILYCSCTTYNWQINRLNLKFIGPSIIL